MLLGGENNGLLWTHLEAWWGMAHEFLWLFRIRLALSEMMFFLQISLLDGLWCDGSSCLKRRLHSCGQSFTKRLPKNEWCGHISTEVDVRCPRCGPVMSRWSNSLIVFLFNECGGMGQTEIENFVFCLPTMAFGSPFCYVAMFVW